MGWNMPFSFILVFIITLMVIVYCIQPTRAYQEQEETE